MGTRIGPQSPCTKEEIDQARLLAVSGNTVKSIAEAVGRSESSTTYCLSRNLSADEKKQRWGVMNPKPAENSRKDNPAPLPVRHPISWSAVSAGRVPDYAR